MGGGIILYCVLACAHAHTPVRSHMPPALFDHLPGAPPGVRVNASRKVWWWRRRWVSLRGYMKGGVNAWWGNPEGFFSLQ